MKKTLVAAALFAAVCCLAGIPAFAEDILNANDLDPVKLTAPANYGPFTVTASAEKDSSIVASDVALTSLDGAIYNSYIRLGGAGKAEYRSVVFATKGPATVTVDGASSSKTDARLINLVSAADGTVIGEIPVTPYTDAHVATGKISIPAAGTYYLTSKSGGVYIYQVVVQ